MVEIFIKAEYTNTNHRSQKQHLTRNWTSDQPLSLLVGLCYQIVPGKTERIQFVVWIILKGVICGHTIVDTTLFYRILFINCWNDYHCVIPVLRSIWSRSSCNWGQRGEAKDDVSHLHISHINYVNIWEFMWWRLTSFQKMINTLPISSLSLLMKETLFFTDRSSLLCVDSSREKSKSNLQKERGQTTMFPSSLSQAFHLFVLPLVEFGVEVSLLGGSPPLGGGLLVRQQDEGHIRVCPVLGAGCQRSVG